MNKQEVIEKLEKEKSPFNSWEDLNRNNALDVALDIVEKLDEQKKPVLTEEEAKWVEGLKDEQKRRPFWTKYSMLYFVTRAGFGYGFSYDNDREDREVELKHYSHEIHAEKERLTNAILYGYEIEKKKLYTVEIPNSNGDGYGVVYLGRNEYNKIELCIWDCYSSIEFADNWKQFDSAQLTESEIKEDFEWAWPFAKEVEND
ncbi:hypothetical protein Si024_00225 [Streptococcus infantarius subsp. infantarius]|nr:hypothetical protein [Streptococcus infantarius subsp. infantarius]